MLQNTLQLEVNCFFQQQMTFIKLFPKKAMKS